MKQKGVFIAFEGLDGSGKTTQLNAIRDKLLKRKIKCREEREPSDGILGLIARGAIKKKINISSHAMALLFAADRYEHVLNDIKPYIDKGVHVITDRFVFSNFAYQGLTSSFDELYQYNKRAIDLLMPNLTVFVDTDPKSSLSRIGVSRIGKELYDREGIAVRENFIKAFDRMKNNANILIVNGNHPEEVVTDEIWKAVEPFFSNLKEV